MLSARDRRWNGTKDFEMGEGGEVLRLQHDGQEPEFGCHDGVRWLAEPARM